MLGHLQNFQILIHVYMIGRKSHVESQEQEDIYTIVQNLNAHSISNVTIHIVFGLNMFVILDGIAHMVKMKMTAKDLPVQVL